MNVIEQTLGSLKVEAPQNFRNLSVFPLTGEAQAEPDYLLLDEALSQKLVHVSEVSESGSVPELCFFNDTDKDVLLLDGEELVGARQNRVLNITILVGGHSKLVIPVSCVERGRWHYHSREFNASKRQLYARARASKMSDVSFSMRADGSRRANQSAVWESIAQKAESLNAYSPTEAMADIYEREQTRLADFEKAFIPVKNQVGAVFAINGRVMGAEVFESDTVFRKFLEKLVGSYAMDAIDMPIGELTSASMDDAKAFLARIQGSVIEAFPAMGKGEDQRLHGRELNGGALVVDDRLLHLSAFTGTH